MALGHPTWLLEASVCLWIPEATATESARLLYPQRLIMGAGKEGCVHAGPEASPLSSPSRVQAVAAVGSLPVGPGVLTPLRSRHHATQPHIQ